MVVVADKCFGSFLGDVSPVVLPSQGGSTAAEVSKWTVRRFVTDVHSSYWLELCRCSVRRTQRSARIPPKTYVLNVTCATHALLPMADAHWDPLDLPLDLNTCFCRWPPRNRLPSPHWTVILKSVPLNEASEPRTTITSDHNYIGSQLHRITITSDHNYIGSQLHRTTITSDHNYIGSQLHQITITSDHNYIGSQLHRTTITSDHNYIGPQLHRITICSDFALIAPHYNVDVGD
jgi:hypothetical protein